MKLGIGAVAAVLIGSTLSGCARKSADELLSRGIERSRAMNHSGAISDFTEVIRLQPDSAEAYAQRGLARSLFTPDFAGAMNDFDAAIRLNPVKPEYRYGRGHVRSKQGDQAGAIADFSEALRPEQKRPGNEVIRANAFMSRAELNLQQGNRSGAIADFEAALNEAPADWPFRSKTEKALGKVRVSR